MIKNCIFSALRNVQIESNAEPSLRILSVEKVVPSWRRVREFLEAENRDRGNDDRFLSTFRYPCLVCHDAR